MAAGQCDRHVVWDDHGSGGHFYHGNLSESQFTTVVADEHDLGQPVDERGYGWCVIPAGRVSGMDERQGIGNHYRVR